MTEEAPTVYAKVYDLKDLSGRGLRKGMRKAFRAAVKSARFTRKNGANMACRITIEMYQPTGDTSDDHDN